MTKLPKVRRGSSGEPPSGATHRRADGEVDPVHFRHLGLPARKNALGVVRLDPALEKPRRNRKMHTLLLDAFQVHSRKPARIDVFSDRRTQSALHARPTILFHICHCLTTFLKE
jgi:hypothetical protein